LAQFGVTGCVLNVREAIARHRKRRKRGLFVRPIIVTKDQLDQLEERGYLNPLGERLTPTSSALRRHYRPRLLPTL
jgi:hypothetical protein